jgi:hypothetical protein
MERGRMIAERAALDQEAASLAERIGQFETKQQQARAQMKQILTDA